MKRVFLIALAVLIAACSSANLDPLPGRRPDDGPAARATRPEVSLRADEFDAASPVSVAEAEKGGGGEPAHAMYACPMHPEVTSETPGTCPKCGMELVKKETK